MRVLGVDGGQAGIRLRRTGDAAAVEVEGVSRLEGDTVAQVAGAVAEGWSRLGGMRGGAGDGAEPVGRVVLGLSTMPSDPAQADRLARLVSGTTGAREIWLADDSVTAHAGALSGGSGVSIVAGTGVACLALAASGNARIIGGHGYLLGDEGGAFWLGRTALNAVLRVAEERGPATTLTQAAERAFGPLADLHVRIHDAVRPVHLVASFAPAVLAAAEAGDAVADGIVREGAMELVMVATSGASWIARSQAVPEPVAVALGGRLLRDGLLRQRVGDLLAQSAGRITAQGAAGTPLDGALALGESGVNPYGSLLRQWASEDA
ncbi:MAG: BadF/BadG/BcrA/BcrD ATPase family protein [Chloroflexota bacterium]